MIRTAVRAAMIVCAGAAIGLGAHWSLVVDAATAQPQPQAEKEACGEAGAIDYDKLMESFK